jgi:two-component system chemotaxis sensor kinase CheA
VSIDLSEFLSGFLAEAADHLRSINANLLLVDTAIATGTPNPRAVRELFRSLHTMKGLAGMVRVESIVDIAHSMERLLRDAEQNGGELPQEAFDPLLQGTQHIAQRVSALATGKATADAPRELLNTLDTLQVVGVTAERPGLLPLQPQLLSKLNQAEIRELSQPSGERRAFQLMFAPSTDRATRGVTISTVREHLAKLAEIVKVVPMAAAPNGLSFVFLIVSSASPVELASVVECDPEQVTELSQPRVTPARSSPADTANELENEPPPAVDVLRVDVRKVDAAMDGVGELLVAKFRLSRAVAALGAKGVDVRELVEAVHDTHRRIRDVRGLVLGLRMISLSELLDRLPILVRGLRATTGKSARVQLEVGRFEVDKAVGERLWPALVHLVRNAVDHGLETAAERESSGKPLQGTILVSCARTSSGRVELRIEDDGIGVDATRVAQRAGAAVPANPGELLDLMTRPGLSTRTAATATSGRGMGLDIVRRIVVDELGGELRLATTPGRGTVFFIEVPITVAVVDAFHCSCATSNFLIPVSNVEEFVDVDAGSVVRGPRAEAVTAQAGMFSRRGRTMPFIELSELTGGAVTQQSAKAIIVRRNEQFFAFGVDKLQGRHEVIVRPLNDPLVDVVGISGAADLGDGKPTLLLDLVALSRVHDEAERAA